MTMLTWFWLLVGVISVAPNMELLSATRHPSSAILICRLLTEVCKRRSRYFTRLNLICGSESGSKNSCLSSSVVSATVTLQWSPSGLEWNKIECWEWKGWALRVGGAWNVHVLTHKLKCLSNHILYWACGASSVCIFLMLNRKSLTNTKLLLL